jgi:hypothetical protein
VSSRRVPLWRVAAALVILGGLVFFLAAFAPLYFRNLKLQNYVSEIARRADPGSQSDEALKRMVLERARQLQLPVSQEDVHVLHTPRGARIDVRYFVEVRLPGYSVNLHFYPGAGSR